MSHITLERAELFEDLSSGSSTHLPEIMPTSNQRDTLESYYIEVTIEYLNTATDDYHRYTEEDLRDERFNQYHEVHSYPRLATLSDQETNEGNKLKQRITQLHRSSLLAQLSLLAGKITDMQDIATPRTHLQPNLVYRDILQSAGVLTCGVYTPTVSLDALRSIRTPYDDAFSDTFLHRGYLNADDVIPDNTQPHLRLIA